MMPKVVLFDVDNTLTRSKSLLSEPVAELLGKLLDRTKAAITSGGNFEQLKIQLADRLPDTAKRENFYLLPTSGGAFFEYSGGEWKPVYEERLSEEQDAEVRAALIEGSEKTGLIDFSSPSYGERIEFRGSQVTLSALGQKAPVEEKDAWDPDQSKRNQLREAVAALLPDYDVKRGGSSSIDVTKPGINKAYGIRKLSEHLSIPISDMLYIGDQLYSGGNDAVVKETGIATRAVTGPGDTARVIEELLAEY